MKNDSDSADITGNEAATSTGASAETMAVLAAENFEIEDIFDLDMHAAAGEYLCSSCCGGSSS